MRSPTPKAIFPPYFPTYLKFIQNDPCFRNKYVLSDFSSIEYLQVSPFYWIVQNISQIKRASTKAGAVQFGEPLLLDWSQVPRLDLVIVASVAVGVNGVRLGKGLGYAELEWAVLVELGVVSERTLVLTTVHEDQVTSTSFFLKLSCYSRNQCGFTACSCVFIVITSVWANQGNYFENATACSKPTLKTTVATQL